jgi:hypothetical protein
MSIPLDRLYHYVEQTAQNIFGGSVIIYRFFPHGSKNIENLHQLSPYLTDPVEWTSSPEIYCNDQEPLNFDAYTEGNKLDTDPIEDEFQARGMYLPRYNFRGQVRTIWDHAILLHSEQRSSDLLKYQHSHFIPVYYWSHALLSLDWFRFAKHIDMKKKSPSSLFLIYNRAWSGSREYRLKFMDMLIDKSLVDSCQTSCNTVEPETAHHYASYQFENPQWRPQNKLEDYFQPNTSPSYYSADFNQQDYVDTLIEVVLETLFDDSRIHLTEKSLRPIALGQPFILMATHGSLAYLKRYGFRTFNEIWDETYDTIIDPLLRMNSVVNLMKSLSEWSDHEWLSKSLLIKEITTHNRQLFFSHEFEGKILFELAINLSDGIRDLIEKNRGEGWTTRYDIILNDPHLLDIQSKILSLEQIEFLRKKVDVFKKHP